MVSSQGLLIDLDFGQPAVSSSVQPPDTQAKSTSIYPHLTNNVPSQQQDASALPGGAVVKAARQLIGAAPGCIKHFVKPTDTTIGICMQYGVTKQQLQEVNKGSTPTHSILLLLSLIVSSPANRSIQR
jgi:spore germination protein YaaH